MSLDEIASNDYSPNVVIHQVPHAVDLSVRTGAVPYADAIECLLDLYEARLDGAARNLMQKLTAGARH